MKIKDMKMTIPPEKIMKTYIDKLMAEKDLSHYELNRIMKYLGFDKEEVICTGIRCHECPYYTKEIGASCVTEFNEYVRHLIARRSGGRGSLEDML